MLEKKISEFSSNLAVENLPVEVLHAAKRCILDWFSAVIPGGLEDPALIISSALVEESKLGSSTIIPSGVATSPRAAALINGIASHTLEVDDIYREGIYHPGPPVISASLALAESRKISGSELVASIIAGYEISNRIAAAMQPEHYQFWHTTGTVGSIGASVGSARVLRLGSKKTEYALANSVTSAAGLQQGLLSDSMTKSFHAGRAAEAGVLCAIAAECGFTGAEYMIQGQKGLGNAMGKSIDWTSEFSQLGAEYTISQMTQKNHFCCGHNFAPVDGVLKIIKQEKIKPQEISSIKIGTYEKAIEICGNYKPQSIYQAKFSLPYTVAVACFQGNVRQKAFSKKWFSDKRVWEFMKNIELNVDKKADSVFPGSREAYITVNTVSKRSFSSRILTRVGDPDAPLSDNELESKFFELVNPVIGRSAADALKTNLWSLEEVADVSQIFRLAS